MFHETTIDGHSDLCSELDAVFALFEHHLCSADQQRFDGTNLLEITIFIRDTMKNVAHVVSRTSSFKRGKRELGLKITRAIGTLNVEFPH